MLMVDFDQVAASRALSRIPVVVSIGVFDGLHTGHLKVIETAVQEARRRRSCSSAVLTFSINPKTVMGRNPYAKPLMSLRQSTDFFSDLGVDYLVVIDFSPEFSKLSGEAFIAKTCSLFDVKAIVVGENFRCGSGAGTGPAEIARLLPRYSEGASVIVPETYRLADGTEDSSTLVRKSLTEGRIAETASLLGRNYALDLAQLPPRIDGYALRFPLGSFVQLLPPPGAYEAVLVGHDKSRTEVVASVDGEFLTLAPAAGLDATARSDRYDSLELIKESLQAC
jgi:riboflavin kinase/FMN adenylyltransferase